MDRLRTSAAKRDYLWRAFHRQSIEELPKKWKEFYEACNITAMAENLFHQTVNVSVYEKLLREKCPPERSATACIEAQLSKDELNAFRYASGCVPAKLLKKYEKIARTGSSGGGKIDQFQTCLGNMAITCDDSDSMKYTSEWFDHVNRGGLFSVNDETLHFFVSVELITRQHLSQCTSQSCASKKQSVIEAILQDVDIQFYWALISQDISEEQDSLELLKDISDMWVTVRGFSMASTWLEEYKKVKNTKVSKKRSLRKELYQKVQDRRT